eukprot:g13803.t1
MQLFQSLTLVALTVLARGYALLFPPNPVPHHVPAGIVRHQAPDTSRVATGATNRQHNTLVAAAAATEGGGGRVSAAGSSAAKESFLGNLERRRAGEDVRSSLDADLSRLSKAGRNQVSESASWRGKWQICYAPHIETLGGVIFTKFGRVQYDFVSDSGKMVSHAEYENPLFGSGWFNADGRVVQVVPAAGDGMAGGDQQAVVKVVFERFWWDRAGEAQPTGSPPGATVDGAESWLDPVDWFVQAAGKAMFFDGLSVFPVLYLDDNLCVFQFKAAGTVVAAQRVG